MYVACAPGPTTIPDAGGVEVVEEAGTVEDGAVVETAVVEVAGGRDDAVPDLDPDVGVFTGLLHAAATTGRPTTNTRKASRGCMDRPIIRAHANPTRHDAQLVDRSDCEPACRRDSEGHTVTRDYLDVVPHDQGFCSLSARSEDCSRRRHEDRVRTGWVIPRRVSAWTS